MAGLDAQVLGRLRVTLDGRELTLGGPAPRVVLSRLIMAGGRLVPDDVLIEDLWQSTPPRTARLTLQGYIASLRRALEPGRGTGPPAVLVRQGPGYSLVLPPGAVDADRFTALAADGAQAMAEGAAHAALGAYDAALALWRGPAYADCADREFALGEAARLGHLRIDAAEGRLGALLGSGGHREAAAALEAFTRDHPLRERGWGLLATALYRSGRPADALAALRDARRRFAEELGADLGPDLVALQAAILRQDDALAASAGSGPAVALVEATVPPNAPPVAPLETPPVAPSTTNIPLALTPLVGRGAEAQDATALLRAHRLVTLTGTGGIGKTRLALEIARDRDDSDGPWLIELAAVRDGALLAEAVASALGIAVPGGLPGLLAVLRERRLLLVLDNCEQIIDAAAQFVTALLSTCPHIRVLATSREALDVPGEQVLDIPPLSVDSTGDAVTLFQQRAAAIAPGWDGGSAGQRELTAALCADLDGLPLAIELAAAQCRVLSIEQLTALAHDRFAVLRGGSRANQRHATMLAAVAWSWDLLADDEREVFDALAVLEGSFDLAAAEAITGRADVLLPLTALIDKSLVTVDGGNPRRYAMLETLRQFAGRQRTAEQLSVLQQRRIAWICALAGAAETKLRGREGAIWLARLGADSANIRAALEDAADDPATTLRIASGVYWFWYRRGHIEEGLRFLRPVVERADASAPAPMRIRAAIGLALLSYLAGDLEAVGGALAQAGELAAATDDVDAQGFALATISFFEAGGGLTQQAIDHANAALRLALATGAQETQAEALMCLGTAHYRSGDLQSAIQQLAEAVAVADACGYAWCSVSSAWLLVKSRIASTEPTEADASTLVAAINSAYAEGDRTSWLVVLTTLAYVLHRHGHSSRAAELVGAIERQGELIGFSPAAMDPADSAGYLAAIRDGMDTAAFAVAAERGRSLSHEQVMAIIG